MKNLKLILLMCLFFSACGRETAVTQKSAFVQYTHSTESLKASLAQKYVKELFLVIFEKDFTVDQWKLIFDETNRLSQNKRSLRELPIHATTEDEKTRVRLISENTAILTDLSGKTLFMLSWSQGDENCRFQKTSDLRLNCKPFNLDNPLNGGLPKNTKPIVWIEPDPVASDIRIPYLSLTLQNLDYSLELRLSPESGNDWFKGSVVPAPGSLFTKEDGTKSSTFFPFGYAEMTTGN